MVDEYIQDPFLCCESIRDDEREVWVIEENMFGLIKVNKNCFYVDKTGFIKEWWESEDEVTLITRPRRFGKTLNMSMLDHFFSLRYNMSDFEYSDKYNVSITNYETKICFDNLVKSWFISCSSPLEDFRKALQRVDVQTMDLCLNKITQQIFSY